MISALAEARLGLRLRRRRSLLTALGIALAAAMLGAAVVVADDLGRGFDRAASASHLADIIVRFNSQPAARVSRRIEQLPDLAVDIPRRGPRWTCRDLSRRRPQRAAGGDAPHRAP